MYDDWQMECCGEPFSGLTALRAADSCPKWFDLRPAPEWRAARLAGTRTYAGR
jgi:hypothetical protein